ncbi:hypothetical protein SAMN05443575_1685 [Jatrophihabitans endophyticus]|uniref:AB hydrolase-1 domain-containing protein n=1 Tax=Jatrophihabitans endophyticus TaxID=1206085 RepID=A0A1M5HYL3_9ACTN|nr:alpha/beta hydrolase [Jatrophihabitans endophyticus]SHG20997.1 hypothetical protein SAMN05443575_1685 [Jatrophihabitans endophyticus]
METISFDSHGTRCEAWYLRALNDDLTTTRGRPVVVMGHGFGATRDSGLLPFAERFAAAGADVLVFDYRGFGTSEGEPRQDVDHRRHREDYHAAIAYARARKGVDAARVAIWGSSYSGGHVVAVAAADQRVAAVISQGAAMDGLAALIGNQTGEGPGKAAATTRAALRDVAGRVRGRPPVMLPIVGAPGSGAVISTPTAEQGYLTIAGPTFRNELCARGVLRVPRNRPVRHAAKVTCPMLVIAAEQDDVAPVKPVHEVAARAPRAELLSFPCGHFDLYVGEVFEKSVVEQVEFLRRVLA